MKQKKSDILTILLFCGFLFGMLICYLAMPKLAFSENEKRYLADAPKVSWTAVASGAWGEDAETYMADHIPGRDFFVGLNAYFDLYTGRQVSKDVWLRGDRLVEAPVEIDSSGAMTRMTVINNFAQTVGRTVDVAIVPSAGWALEGVSGGYLDDAIIRGISAMAGENVNPVDMLSVFENNPQLYFKTDHHWNSAGAYAGYAAYMNALGREPVGEDSFRKEVFGTFRGSTYSRSALWLTPGEELELWQGSDCLTVTNAETEGEHAGVFYWERLEEADKYTVFLDGNHSLVRIHNPNGQGKLLVIRDSYSNSLGCFLAESYGEVVLVDLRYYLGAVSELAAQEGFDNILVCYSIGNFMTDTNIIRLR